MIKGTAAVLRLIKKSDWLRAIFVSVSARDAVADVELEIVAALLVSSLYTLSITAFSIVMSLSLLLPFAATHGPMFRKT